MVFDYAFILETIECKLDLITNAPKNVREFISKLESSDVGSLEDRIEKSINFVMSLGTILQTPPLPQEGEKFYTDFVAYAFNLRKIPSNALWAEYLEDIKKKNTQFVTSREAEYIKARKVWSDAVSETALENQKFIKQNRVEAIAISRIKQLGITAPEQIYQQCLDYLRNNTVLTVSFNPQHLDEELADFQLLNMFERENPRAISNYFDIRENTEVEAFKHLSPNLYADFCKNKQARPRYGALRIIGSEEPLGPTKVYGDSFIVLKDIVKYNSLFVPADSFIEKYKVCTIHHLELLLLQCPLNTLKALVNRIIGGALPVGYDQGWCKNIVSGGYIEVMLAAINIFDPNCIEHIYINSKNYKVPPKSMEMIRKLGVQITNSNILPYKQLYLQFLSEIKNDNAHIVNQFLSDYPSLSTYLGPQNTSVVHIAAQYGSVQSLLIFAKRNFCFTQYTTTQYSPLQIAAQYNQFDAVELIVTTIQRLTKAPISDIINASINSTTAFHIAKAQEHKKIIDYLILSGANGNILNNSIRSTGGTSLFKHTKSFDDSPPLDHKEDSLRPKLVKPSSIVYLNVLGLFVAAIGVTAVVVAFAMLNAATLATTGVALAIGGAAVVAILVGYGVFKKGQNNCPNEYESPLYFNYL